MTDETRDGVTEADREACAKWRRLHKMCGPYMDTAHTTVEVRCLEELFAAHRQLAARVTELEAEVAALREVLAFYADPISWMWWTSRPETKEQTKALIDHGDKARAALAATAPKEGE